MKPQTQLTRHASPGSKHVSKSKPSSCSSTFSHLGQRIIKASTWFVLCLFHHGGQISILDQPCLPTTIGQRLTTHPSCNNNMLTHHFYISYCEDTIQNFKKLVMSLPVRSIWPPPQLPRPPDDGDCLDTWCRWQGVPRKGKIGLHAKSLSQKVARRILIPYN